MTELQPFRVMTGINRNNGMILIEIFIDGEEVFSVQMIPRDLDDLIAQLQETRSAMRLQ